MEIGKDVDVLSSLLRGHLEAGASRVVRATGADEDWGMRALQKLVEGKGRKIEGIADYWRDEVRRGRWQLTDPRLTLLRCAPSSSDSRTSLTLSNSEVSSCAITSGRCAISNSWMTLVQKPLAFIWRARVASISWIAVQRTALLILRFRMSGSLTMKLPKRVKHRRDRV